jgi:CRP-like cAMP-binding protein
MEQIRQAIGQMINLSANERAEFEGRLFIKTYKRQEILSAQNIIPHEIFFINKGLIRISINDAEGNEHTVHFALENQFIVDYAAFIKQEKSRYTLQALEDTEVVVMPRKAIEWGYDTLREGQKLGRLIAEFYYIYQDERIKNRYVQTPKQRYDNITDTFPNIHNRVPQHMIASYLGISSVHLSRLKKNKKDIL